MAQPIPQSTDQQIFQMATDVTTALEISRSHIENMEPINQAKEQTLILQLANNLTKLQNLARDILTGSKRTRLTDAQRLQISEKLQASSTLLGILDENITTASELCFLATDVELAFNLPTVDQTTIKSLKDRATELSHREHINTGNRTALQTIQEALAAQANSVLQQAPSNATVHSSAAIIGTQEEEFTVGTYADTLNQYSTEKNFDTLLAFYKDAKKYAGETTFILLANKQKMSEILQRTESVLDAIISDQEKTEGVQTPQTPISSPSSSSASLESMKAALKEFENKEPNMLAVNQKVREAFSQLSYEEKNSLYGELNDILKRAKTPLPGTLQGNFMLWGGTPANKLEAVERALSKFSASTESTSSTPEIEKKSVEMKKRLAEAKNASLPPLSICMEELFPGGLNETLPQEHVQALHEMLNIAFPTRRDQSPPSTLVKIQVLQQVLLLLQENGSYQDLETALKLLTELEQQDLGASMTISFGSFTSIVNVASRAYFHLLSIHRSEGKVQNADDAAYGQNAMAGFYEVTNLERSRAVSRTIIELALDGLEKAILNIQVGEMKAMLQILETTAMDPLDLPEGKNIAHALFGNMYKYHCKARERDPQLIDPNAPQFNGDFGRNAYASFEQGIGSLVKNIALTELRKDLKATWKL